MDRSALKKDLYGIVAPSLERVMMVVSQRYNPIINGYPEFADGLGAANRTEEEWAGYTPEQRFKYESWSKVNRCADRLGDAFNKVDSPASLSDALLKLTVQARRMDALASVLDPQVDAELIGKLDDAARKLQLRIKDEQQQQHQR